MISLPASKQTWQSVLLKCGCSPFIADRWSGSFAANIKPTTFSKGPVELLDFLPTILHESEMLTKMEESLYYSTPGRLMVVWPSRFKTLASEVPYMRNPEKLANFVYGGRMGNTRPDSGWRYRGRGVIGLTGYDNYLQTGRKVGVDLAGNPDLAGLPEGALPIAIAWWEGKVPDALIGDPVAIRQKVNGGTIGMDKVLRLVNVVKAALA